MPASARSRSSSRPPALEIAGVPITSPDRVLFPAAKLTKLDVLRYYDCVADVMLPHLRARPLTLRQCAPDVDHCRYLRHSGERAPSQVRVVNIQEQTKVGDYMVVDDRRGLIALAQRNIVEFHTWNSTADRVENPDRIVFDLDPGPEVPWKTMVDAATLVRDTLLGVGLRTWLKTTGGKGLHIVAPIVPADDWSTCLAVARTIAEQIAAHDPRRFTTKFSKAARARLILIDYLRNNRTNTSVAAYSLRARPAATVSLPITWEALTRRLKPEKWTVETVPRLARERDDPWAGYFTIRQRLPVRIADR